MGIWPHSPKGPQVKLELERMALLCQSHCWGQSPCTLCRNPINVTWECSVTYNPCTTKGSLE